MQSNPGHVQGTPNKFLRLEGLLLLLFGSAFYFHRPNASWQTFLLLFFIPDLSFLAYGLNAKIGAWAYNIMHSLISPLFLLGALFFYGTLDSWLFIIAIWVAHIGFDRALGYGLKYEKGFGYTHLGLLTRWIK